MSQSSLRSTSTSQGIRYDDTDLDRAVKRPDGRDWYTHRGLLLRARLGGPDGEVLADRVHNAICETCRGLMARGIVGVFETWKAGIPYPSMRGDIASTAELTVHEPDDGVVHFAKWRPFRQDAVSRSAVLAPAREDDAAGRGRVAADMIASSSARAQLENTKAALSLRLSGRSVTRTE